MKLATLIALSLVSASCVCAQVRVVTEQELIATTLIREAGGERDPRAMAAVYEVICNRANQQHKSRSSIVLQPKQFSCWNNVSDYQRAVEEARAHQRYADALKIAALSRCNTDYTQGATYYHATRVNPYWASSCEKTVTIEKHVFYKSVKIGR